MVSGLRSDAARRPRIRLRDIPAGDQGRSSRQAPRACGVKDQIGIRPRSAEWPAGVGDRQSALWQPDWGQVAALLSVRSAGADAGELFRRLEGWAGDERSDACQGDGAAVRGTCGVGVAWGDAGEFVLGGGADVRGREKRHSSGTERLVGAVSERDARQKIT
jgi:hypothetical protein